MSKNKTGITTHISAKLLKWYDIHARDLPWRVSPKNRANGVLPDPYHVWLSEIMLQQTTVVTVGPYFHSFLKRWPKIEDLAAADDADVMAEWAGLGYYARARNLLKCARFISNDLAGIFPRDQTALLDLPGVGPYTAAALSCIAFDLPATVLDGNIERVMARLFCIQDPLPHSKPVLFELASQATPARRVGDYVQAVMDLGATICTPRKPKCLSCPLMSICAAHGDGIAETLPQKTPKKPKPTRHGIAYFAYTHDGKILLETRPATGLLGGMLALPCSEWVEDTIIPNPPFAADWYQIPENLRHVFTHFNLNLTVLVAPIGNANPSRGALFAMPDPQTLPSVMRKAYEMGLKTVANSAKSDD